MLLPRLCLHLIADLLRCPLQWTVNFVKKKNHHTESLICRNLDDCELNDVCIVLHHYAPRGLAFWKNAGGADYLVGIGIVLEQLKDAGLSVTCFVADSTDDYLLDLQVNFSDINFIATDGRKYDFFSYIRTSTLIDNSNCKYYCMFNDNVDYLSDIIGFTKSAKNAVTSTCIGMVGVGSNTFLTQSFFRKSFSPHVQTYGFFIKKDIFDQFSADCGWFLASKEPKILIKSAVCRLLEQGLSKSVLRGRYDLGFIQNKRLVTYRRRLKNLDLEKDWTGTSGDYRNSCPSPFLFLGFND